MDTRINCIVLGVIMLTGCGGGGGTSTGQSDGSITQVTCANFTSPPAPALAYSGSTASASVDTSSLLPYSQDMFAAMTALDNLKVLAPVPMRTAPSTESCISSGSEGGPGTVDTVIDERPDGSGYSYAWYNQYPVPANGGGNYIVSGIAYATFASSSAGAPQSETVSFTDFHVTAGRQLDVTLNGTATIDSPANEMLASRDLYREGVEADMVIADAQNGRTIWAHNLSYSDTLDATLGSGYVDRSGSGTLYDTNVGFATVSTVNPVTLAVQLGAQGLSLQVQGGGPLKFTGGTASTGYFIPLSLTLDAIALDDAGNGTLNRSARVDAGTFGLDTASYPSLSGPVPMAAIGDATTVAQSSVPPTVDGLRSYSPAGKFVTYDWSMLSHPGASSATLSNVSSAIPTLVPDVPGTYLLQLTVSDGQTSNSQDVPLTALRGINGVTLQLSHAVAGPDLQAHVGQTVTADGKASVGIGTGVWEFEWMLVPPPGSSATLSYTKPFAMAQDQSQTTFVPDVPGFYQLVLEESGTNGYFTPVPGATQIVAVDTGFDLHRPATVVDASEYTFGFKYAVGDFNGDGIMDVAVAGLAFSTSPPVSTRLKVYYGSKQGGFSAPTVMSVASAGPNAIFAADVNNDGRTDLVMDASGVFVVLQQADGTLGPGTQIGSSSSCLTGTSPLQLLGVGPWKGAATDSIYTILGSCIDIYSNTSATQFASAGTVTSPFSTIGVYPYTVQFADVTGDGVADMLGMHFAAQTSLAVFPGQTGGAFGAPVTYGLPDFAIGMEPFEPFVLGDLNHDGLLDVAALDGGNVDIFLQDSSHVFAAATRPTILTKPAQGSGFITADVTGGDLDGDGREDLLVHHFDYTYQDPADPNIYADPTYLGVLLQGTTGAFGPELLYPLSLNWSSSITQSNPMVVGDFNGDGLPDVIMFDGSGDLFILYQKPFK